MIAETTLSNALPLDQTYAARHVLHDLCQPLTSLAFLLELARDEEEPEAWRDALTAGLVECRRTFTEVERLRAVLREERKVSR